MQTRFNCGKGMRQKVHTIVYPDSKIHGANMGPIWGRQHPGGPHVGPMNVAIWEYSNFNGGIGHFAI